MPKEIEFEAPKGFLPPEDSEPGKPFEVLATIRLKEDGKLCLEALDGAPVGEKYADKESKPEMPDDEDDFLGAVEKRMTA